MKVYNKLIRDNIPEIIKENGQTPYISVLDNEQYDAELKKKLCEETKEFLDSEEIEELADIVEVVEALANANGSSLENVLKIKEQKAAKNGKFEKKLFLEKVDG
ncbi:MAG: nucleoside triphosphate pyrophosphohydrolase [Eubacterium sp.]|nr:nucleoside triphosphate pyrophosphohydrolase [Eubacterium sp.]